MSKFKKGDLVKATIYSQNGQQFHRPLPDGAYGSDDYLGILIKNINTYSVLESEAYYEVYLFRMNESLLFVSDELRKLSI
jgi:hypothetical protein